jgi:hypothetical protein
MITNLFLGDRVARCSHRCRWCFEMIQPRETYTRWTYVYDGFMSEPFHPECFTAMNKSHDYDYDDARCSEKHARGEICNH